jgi:cytosine/creatinine deaminase
MGQIIHGSPEVDDHGFLQLAYEQALKSYREGGIPVGAVMVEDGKVISVGHNRRVQDNDPVAHGEINCIKNAGRRSRYERVTLYTTLAPCMMCAGSIIQFGIKRVVVGEDRSYKGYIRLMRDCGVEVLLLDDENCRRLMSEFIASRPDLWDEDIAGNS